MKSRHPAKNSPPTGTLLRLGCMAVLLGFALAVSAAAAGAETCISTGPGSQNNARISGDWIVWVDKSDGYDIILYNLTTLTFTRFTGIPDQDYPSIDGNLVVWQGDNPEHLTTDIFLYDISRRNLTNLINDLQDFQYFPDVSGDRIVWVDDRHWSTSRWDVYLYNVTTHTESRISSDSADQDDPAIDGNYVVWEDFRNGNADIFLYDIPAGQLTPLVTGTSNQHYPRISGTRVVYQDDRNGYQDIYLYDFLTSQETRITSNESGSYFPKIDGDRIVWTDYRNGNADIYLHNITTGVETRITTDPYDQVGPDISGNRIVWMDKRQGDHNVYAIYLYTLDGTPDPDPTPIPTPTPTPTPIPEQLVMTTGTATTYTYLGYTSTYLQQAQSFKVADTGISRVAVALAKRGSPILDITLSVRNTVKGPDLSRATIVPSRVTSTDYKKPTWVEVPLDLRGKLTKGSTCYVVLSVSSSDSRNCYLVPLNGYNPFKEGYLYKNTIGSQTASSEMLMKVWFTDGAPMPPPAPTADFSGTPVSGNAPLAVQFTDASTGTISSYVWDFGDGNTSTQRSPLHTYALTGLFSVNLTVSGPGGINSRVRTNYITVNLPAPTADFTGTPASGNAPLEVQFTDASTGTISSYVWDFGDGNMSTQRSPLHTYALTGLFSVNLTVSGPGGINSKVRTNYITVNLPAPDPEPGQLVTTTEVTTTSTYLAYSSSYVKQAQSLKAADTGISRIAVGLARKGTPSLNLTVRVKAALNGPDLATATITPAMVTSTDSSSPSWVEVPVGKENLLTAGSTLYVVLDAGTYDLRNYYYVPLNSGNPYADGIHYRGTSFFPNSVSDMLVKVWFTGGTG